MKEVTEIPPTKVTTGRPGAESSCSAAETSQARRPGSRPLPGANLGIGWTLLRVVP